MRTTKGQRGPNQQQELRLLAGKKQLDSATDRSSDRTGYDDMNRAAVKGKEGRPRQESGIGRDEGTCASSRNDRNDDSAVMKVNSVEASVASRSAPAA